MFDIIQISFQSFSEIMSKVSNAFSRSAALVVAYSFSECKKSLERDPADETTNANDAYAWTWRVSTQRLPLTLNHFETFHCRALWLKHNSAEWWVFHHFQFRFEKHQQTASIEYGFGIINLVKSLASNVSALQKSFAIKLRNWSYQKVGRELIEIPWNSHWTTALTFRA